MGGRLVPVMCEPVARAYDLHDQLGRDSEGRALVAEQEALLKREGIETEAEKGFLRYLWRVIDHETAAVRSEEQRERQENQPKGAPAGRGWRPKRR